MTQPIVLSYSRVEPALYRNFAKAISKIGRNDRSGLWMWKFAVWLALVILTTWVMRLDALRAIETKPLIGAFAVGVLVMLFARVYAFWALHRRMYTVFEQSQNRLGPTSVQFGLDGCRFDSPVAKSDLKWQAIDEILDLKTGTGLRSGLYVYLLPNESLPEGMSPDEFRETLEAWRTGS